MQKAGYVASVSIGGMTPPPPSKIAPIMSTNPSARNEVSGHVALSRIPPRQGEAKAAEDAEMTRREEDEEEVVVTGFGTRESEVTRENISTRRLWVGLKYWNQRPVLEKMGMVSKPTRRVWNNVPELERLARGEKVGYVRGLRGVGESMYLTTDKGILEIREALERKVGGMLLCRVNQPW